MLDLGRLLDPVALGAAVGAAAKGADGLAIVEQEVNRTVTELTTQLETITNNQFTTHGYIATGSFGQGKEAVDLAREHVRAHGVIVKSLEQTVADLETFLEAIREAKRLIRTSDEDAQDRLNAVLARTEALALGTTGAQDPPPADPAPDPGGSGGGPQPAPADGTDV